MKLSWVFTVHKMQNNTVKWFNQDLTFLLLEKSMCVKIAKTLQEKDLVIMIDTAFT